MMGESAADSLTYRERDVDDTLVDHDRRISRLEKAGLIVLGYAVAEGANIATVLMGFV